MENLNHCFATPFEPLYDYHMMASEVAPAHRDILDGPRTLNNPPCIWEDYAPMDRRILDFIGFPGQGVTSDGRVWSFYRMAFMSSYLRMSSNSHKQGRLSIDLKEAPLEDKWYVSRLVALAFVPINKIGWHWKLLEVDHINGDPRDNRAMNLRWLTPYEHRQLERYYVYVHLQLTEDSLREIFQRLKAGCSVSNVSLEMDLPYGYVARLERGTMETFVSAQDQFSDLF